MTLEIRLRPAARADLADIWIYIAGDSEAAADRLLDRMERSLIRLSHTPSAGRARPELGIGLRSLPVGNYVIFYRVTVDAIVLTRVLSGYRDLDEMDFR